MPSMHESSSPPWTLSIRQFGLLVIALTIAAVTLGVLGSRINGELSALTEASNDNLQWEMAQLDVELLVLINAVRTAQLTPTASLADVRKRFDIYYSRVAFNAKRRGGLTPRDDGRSTTALRDMEATLKQQFALIDGPDEPLRQHLADLVAIFETLRTTTRYVTLEYVRLFAQKSDIDRQSLAGLIQQTALVGATLILVLLLSILFLVRQFQVSVNRARVIQESNDRFENTIYASLDAILVTDADGKILEFNPAAERMFGFSRDAAVGAPMSELIVPHRLRESHRKGVARFIASGEFQLFKTGRVITDALRANGEEFPVELSLGSTNRGTGRIMIGFVRDISDRLRAERELIAARDAALAAARAKSNFLAFMSHEMRTPLNGVLAILDLMRNTPLNDRQRGYIDTATMSGEILLHHIGDVLDLTRIEADALTIREEAFDLVTMIEEVTAINRPLAAAQKDRIELQLQLPRLHVRGDRSRLRQILMNLVGNAVKFTRHGVITIEAHARPIDAARTEIELAVADTGIGIADDQLAHIFKEFVTLDPTDRQTPQGAGLGLSISHRLADMMGGRLTVASTLNRGSRFSLTIPLRVAPPADLPSPAPAEPPGVMPRQGLSVLLVEDNETNRFVGREMLTSLGCIVTDAEDGREGVALAEATAFDVILMDINMPHLDGIEATHAIRTSATARSRRTPIIGLTAHVLPQDEATLLAAGMHRCLFKPLRLHELSALIVDLFGARQPPADPPALPSPAAQEADDILDHDTIAELTEVLDPAQLADRIAHYCQELATLDQVLARDAAEGGPAELGRTAHRLAGSAAVFGARDLRLALLDLERACRHGSAATIAELQARAGALAPLSARALTVLVAELASPSPEEDQ